MKECVTVIDNWLKRLGSVTGWSLYAGIAYSLFEGIRMSFDFPLYSFPGVVETALGNVLIFVGGGLALFVLFNLLGRLLNIRAPNVVPFTLSALVSIPLYFFLLSNFEGTGLIYRYLSGLKLIAFLMILPVFLFFALFSRSVSDNLGRRFAGLTVSVFFFINIGHLYVEWHALAKGKLTGFSTLLLMLALHLALFFAVVVLQEAYRRVHRFCERSVRLRASLLSVLCLSFLSLLWLTFRGTGPLQKRSPGDTPNVLLIVLDTARSDRFSCYGYDRDTTPFLRLFSEEAVLYPEVISPAPWTIPAHASIFTGLYPSAHGLWKNLFLNDRFQTLPEFLASRGYVTVGICNNPHITRENGLARGFDIYIEMWREDMISPTLFYRIEWFLRRLLDRHDGGAMRTNRWVMEWINRLYRGEQPFFLFVNLMECHLGYDAPGRYHKRYLREGYSSKPLGITKNRFRFLTGVDTMTASEWKDFGDAYDGDLYYLDEKLRELIRFLEEKSFLENTIVVITSDHGEHLGEHRMIGHELSLYEPVVRVPLIIKTPDYLQGLADIPGPVQTVDLYPTLLELLGFEDEAGEGRFQGHSLVGEEESPHSFVISEYGVSKGRITSFLKEHPREKDILKYDRDLKAIWSDSLKYIWSSTGDSELYDLSMDPGEVGNLRDERSEVARDLEGRLMSWLGSFEHEVGPEEEGRELDSETRQRLRALGYID